MGYWSKHNIGHLAYDGIPHVTDVSMGFLAYNDIQPLWWPVIMPGKVWRRCPMLSSGLQAYGEYCREQNGTTRENIKEGD